jgi:hypothetical protein
MSLQTTGQKHDHDAMRAGVKSASGLPLALRPALTYATSACSVS